MYLLSSQFDAIIYTPIAKISIDAAGSTAFIALKASLLICILLLIGTE